MRDTIAFLIHPAKVILSINVSLFCSLVKPEMCLYNTAWPIQTFYIHPGKIILSISQSLFCSFTIPYFRLIKILGYT